jgi:hypothetical protein
VAEAKEKRMGKNIPLEYVAGLYARMERGETPRKNTDIAPRDFIRQMLPHVKNFLAQGYTYKEIAEFLGHVSAGDLKKAVAKENPAPASRKNAVRKGGKNCLDNLEIRE